MLSESDLKILNHHVSCLTARLVADRRDFHRHAETGWTEFRTASLIARRLYELGLQVKVGPEVLDREARMGVPPLDELEAQWYRALAQGGDPEFLEMMRGGFTGVVGILDWGPGPVVGLRFDIDALDLVESKDLDHRPVAEGFASINEGATHACGHDGHAAIGLGVAQLLTQLGEGLSGTVKLVFQPAEEGVRGAKAMVEAGIIDDVDVMLGLHVYSGWPLGHLAPGRGGFFATKKFDALLRGAPAHAGGHPEGGKNALLAAATAVLNLHAIPRHRGGATRINVGRLTAGQGRNVVCPEARLVIETRGATSALSDYMYASALRVLETAAAMYQCDLTILPMGSAESAESDAPLAERVWSVAERLGGYEYRQTSASGGSEDFTYMMRRVQERGGLAVNIGLGADLGGWGHHTAVFDFDERVLPLAVRLLVALVIDLLREPVGHVA